MRWIVLVMLGLVVGCAREPQDPAQALEERLIAPCCWRQTLADHDSPTATALRAEIRDQLAAGVSPADIERGLVERYGPRIQALGSGDDDPRWIIGVAVGAAAVLGIGVLLAIMRRRPRAAASSPPPVEDAQYSDRLDDELAYVD